MSSRQPLSKQTPSQTLGPFFAFGLTAEQYDYPGVQIADGNLADDPVPGARIIITGRVFDGAGAPVPDALVEIWQADSTGRYPNAGGSNLGFRGFGRQGTGVDDENRFRFRTVKPGPIDASQAPHINVIVAMRGLLSHIYTRIYFADEAEANARDPVLALVPPERRQTLIAAREDAPDGETVYRFDIRMQGENETVFFDV
jgi:protocatechuate 3,4-dioxygenase alpha subunit